MPEIITRAEAKARGLKRYFTGLVCPLGHHAERLVSTRGCVGCSRERKYPRSEKAKQAARERVRVWTARNLEKVKADKRKWASLNPEKTREARRRWNAKNRQKTEAYRRANPEIFRASGRKYYSKNKDRAKEYRKEYRERPGVRERYNGLSKKYWRTGPQNPTGEKQWLSKAKAQVRNLKRLLRHPNRDHSNWLSAVPRR